MFSIRTRLFLNTLPFTCTARGARQAGAARKAARKAHLQVHLVVHVLVDLLGVAVPAGTRVSSRRSQRSAPAGHGGRAGRRPGNRQQGFPRERGTHLLSNRRSTRMRRIQSTFVGRRASRVPLRLPATPHGLSAELRVT